MENNFINQEVVMLATNNFVALQKEIFHAFNKRKFNEIHSLIDKAQSEFPERLEKTLFWRACAYSLENKLEKAIQALKKGLEKGIWWNPQTLTGDSDLKSLHKLEAFQTIVQKCEQFLEKKNPEAKPQLFTYGNHTANTGIFSLHWRGSNVDDFAPYWLDTNTLKEYYFGFPQSSQVYGYNAYKWDHPEIATKDILYTFEQFKGQSNAKNVILAGASQGGKLAIEFSINKNVDVTGFIAVIPAIQDLSQFEKHLKENPVSGIKGCIITGDEDYFYEKTVELTQLFKKYNLPCKFIVKEGLGHFFPADFTNLLKEAVDYILDY